MRRLSIDDDYMARAHSPSTPMQIGSLQLYDVPADRIGTFAADVRAHLVRRLPSAGVLCVRRSAPFGFDTDQWVELGPGGVEHVVRLWDAPEPPSRREVHELVAGWVMEPLDPDAPPVRIVIIERLAEGGAAVFVTMHHAFADGIGFQALLGKITDPTPEGAPEPPSRSRRDRVPSAPEWVVRSSVRFVREAVARRRRAGEVALARAEADAFKRSPEHARPRTPRFALSGPTSDTRSYSTLSLPIEAFSAIGRRVGGTVNDAFLAVGAGAVRSYLLEIGQLPDEPLVALAARSYRRPEHGELGNRIVSLQPSLATDVEDPVARFGIIQRSMRMEIDRSRRHEAMIDHDDRPFGARRRAQRSSKRQREGQSLLPGNITLSNVPGPAEARYLAGYRQTANYPAPILGYGRFLNITLRRYRQALDLGIMTDAAKIPVADVVRTHIEAALDELSTVAPA